MTLIIWVSNEGQIVSTVLLLCLTVFHFSARETTPPPSSTQPSDSSTSAVDHHTQPSEDDLNTLPTQPSESQCSEMESTQTSTSMEAIAATDAPHPRHSLSEDVTHDGLSMEKTQRSVSGMTGDLATTNEPQSTQPSASEVSMMDTQPSESFVSAHSDKSSLELQRTQHSGDSFMDITQASETDVAEEEGWEWGEEKGEGMAQCEEGTLHEKDQGSVPVDHSGVGPGSGVEQAS